MSYEPKHAVQDALGQAVKGSTSGSWLTADPRPNLPYVKHIIQDALDDGEEWFYDFLLDVAKRAARNAEHERQMHESMILRRIEELAHDTDSFRMHVFVEQLRAKMYPKKEAGE